MKKNLIFLCLMFVHLTSKSEITSHPALTKSLFGKYAWSNWSNNHQCNPQKIYYPETINEVVDLIKESSQKNTPVRFVGSGHSFNDLVCTTGYLIHTKRFKKILSVNHQNNTVQVEAGIKMYKLYKQLADYNLALENQGFIAEQTIAGALATGTHGTGQTSILSSFITGVELFDANGNYHKIDAEHNPEWLPLVRLHLGAFGFIYSVTLQCVPLFVLEHTKKTSTWENVLKNYKNNFYTNDYYMVMGHPMSDILLEYYWNKTDKEPTNNFAEKLKQDTIQSEVMNYLSFKLSNALPEITREFLEWFFKIIAHGPIREYSYKTLTQIKDPPQVNNYIEQEIAIALDDFSEALIEVLELYESYVNQGFNLVGTITCRFVKGDESCLLGTAYGRDSAYISISNTTVSSKNKKFFNAFQEIMKKYDGRSHWAKYNLLTQKDVLSLYGNAVQQFNALRKRFDPRGIFANDYIIRLFGTV